MRIVLGIVCASLLATGCMHHQSQAQSHKPVIKPDFRVLGQVEMVNNEGRFVVISFPPGAVPPIDHHLDVYRRGLKVAEVRVSGPQRGADTVADILTGEVQVHDETRDQ